MSVSGDVITVITRLVMTQMYPIFSMRFFFNNFEVYSYYVILATLTAETKDIYFYLCKELYDRRTFAHVICSLFSIDLDARTYEISTFIRAASEGPRKKNRFYFLIKQRPKIVVNFT